MLNVVLRLAVIIGLGVIGLGPIVFFFTIPAGAGVTPKSLRGVLVHRAASQAWLAILVHLAILLPAKRARIRAILREA